LKERIKEYEERMCRIKTRLEEIVECIKKREEEEQKEKRDSSRREGARGLSSIESERENSNIKSEGETNIGSGLSVKEVERIRKWVTEKDREDRRRSYQRDTNA